MLDRFLRAINERHDDDDQRDVTITDFKRVKVVEKVKLPDGTKLTRTIKYYGRRRTARSWASAVAGTVIVGMLTVAAVYTGQLEILIKYLIP
jgi:hypothetical protein